MLRKLCLQYTQLTQEEILQLERLEEQMQYFADLSGTDLFIDCFAPGEEYGVVAAHAKPAKSLYHNRIVGEIVLPRNEPAVFHALKNNMVVRDLKGVTQENRIVKQYTVPVKNNQGKIIAVIVKEKDFTNIYIENERLRELKETAEQLTDNLLSGAQSSSLITNHVSDGIVIFNKNRVASFVNSEARKIYGELGFGEVIVGFCFDDLSLDCGGKIDDILAGRITEYETEVGERTLKIKYKLPSQESDISLVMLLEDVTDIKRKEKELISKSVVVQEMHHRIKNSLQTIVSMLSMQARRSSCPETIAALQENIGRVGSISAIHEILCGSVDNERISLLALAQRIRENLLRYAVPEGKEIEISVGGDDLLVDSDRAVSIAIVLNELISNSLEHGFSKKDKGRVEIQLTKGILYCSAAVLDDGCGYTPELIGKNHLGLEIIKTMVEDNLHGKLRVTTGERGTQTYFDFKLE
ncbi:sensor histidine kinase [Youxingia wuxianensis]|uniref:histidine kinase n=1 Tax=Youxingia wuxianensis TaxID=2763678 RepID=A0A926EP70_9FIRM|nr:sensor histidine kinase [Youxingia wuxianensis]MBC8585231.1 sensor histidine kinase [Youxingia wuxianensis]